MRFCVLSITIAYYRMRIREQITKINTALMALLIIASLVIGFVSVGISKTCKYPHSDYALNLKQIGEKPRNWANN